MSPAAVEPMGDLPEQVTLWRCACCGRWSFAKRRPTHHERTITELVDERGEPFEECQWYSDGEREDGRTRSDPEAQAADWELPTLSADAGLTIQDDRADYVPGKVVVKCGPFVEYTAYLRAQWHKDPKAKAHASQLSAESADPLPASYYATDSIQFGPGHPPGGTRTTLEETFAGASTVADDDPFPFL